MSSLTFDPRQPFDAGTAGRAPRRASTKDVGAILALIASARPDETLPDRRFIEALVVRGWFLLLEDAPGHLIGAVHVRMAGDIGQVSFLTMRPSHRGHALAARLLGTADALCAAHGCMPQEERDVAAAA